MVGSDCVSLEQERKRNCSLIYASESNNVQLVKILLENQADPNETKGLKNSLIWASDHDNLEMVRVLLEHGAEINPGLKNAYKLKKMSSIIDKQKRKEDKKNRRLLKVQTK